MARIHDRQVDDYIISGQFAGGKLYLIKANGTVVTVEEGQTAPDNSFQTSQLNASQAGGSVVSGSFLGTTLILNNEDGERIVISGQAPTESLPGMMGQSVHAEQNCDSIVGGSIDGGTITLFKLCGDTVIIEGYEDSDEYPDEPDFEITTTTTTESPTTTTSTTSEMFDCDMANLTIQSGEVGQPVVATVDVGTISSIYPTTYVGGSQEYEVIIAIPSGYVNGGANIICRETITTTVVDVCNDPIQILPFTQQTQNFTQSTASGGDSTIEFFGIIYLSDVSNLTVGQKLYLSDEAMADPAFTNQAGTIVENIDITAIDTANSRIQFFANDFTFFGHGEGKVNYAAGGYDLCTSVGSPTTTTTTTESVVLTQTTMATVLRDTSNPPVYAMNYSDPQLLKNDIYSWYYSDSNAGSAGSYYNVDNNPIEVGTNVFGYNTNVFDSSVSGLRFHMDFGDEGYKIVEWSDGVVQQVWTIGNIAGIISDGSDGFDVI